MTRRLRVEVGDRIRTCLVDLPPDAGDEPLPLVLMFHGAGATAALARENTGWSVLGARERFICAYPEGTAPDPSRPPMFRQNPQTWNDGSGRGHVARLGVDDVAFTAALLDRLLETAPVDPRRVFAAGFSNGASMTFRLGVELADRLAAIAPVSGHLWLPAPRLTRPVSLFYVFGSVDPLNPLDGGEVRTPWGHTEYHPPVRVSLDRWRVALGCDEAPARSVERAGVRLERYAGCCDGAEVCFCLVEGLGHVWPGGRRMLPEHLIGPASDRLFGSEAIWRFFAHRPSR